MFDCFFCFFFFLFFFFFFGGGGGRDGGERLTQWAINLTKQMQLFHFNNSIYTN